MDLLSEHEPVEMVCAAFDIARSRYYAALNTAALMPAA
jgi:hypothetical protein